VINKNNDDNGIEEEIKEFSSRFFLLGKSEEIKEGFRACIW